ncbi:MAG: glycosyltransferase, partial [Bacteroidota bacterium]
LLAETPEQFLEQTSRCMNDPAYARQIGRNARELIEKHFSIQEGARQLDRFLERLIREDQ